MLLRNISNVDPVAAGNVKLKKIMKMGIHLQTKVNLHYREKLYTSHKFIINLWLVFGSESATIFPLEESLDKISLFHDFFDSKWNSLTQEKNFPMTFPWPIANTYLGEVEKESGMCETKVACHVTQLFFPTNKWLRNVTSLTTST